jgi:hypothetical protein
MVALVRSIIDTYLSVKKYKKYDMQDMHNGMQIYNELMIGNIRVCMKNVNNINVHRIRFSVELLVTDERFSITFAELVAAQIQFAEHKRNSNFHKKYQASALFKENKKLVEEALKKFKFMDATGNDRQPSVPDFSGYDTRGDETAIGYLGLNAYRSMRILKGLGF